MAEFKISEFRITDTEIKCMIDKDQNTELDWIEKVFGPRNDHKLYMDTIILDMSRKIAEDIDNTIIEAYIESEMEWLKNKS